MRFEHIVRKMPRELRELIIEQKWCSSLLEQGVAFPDLMTDRKYLAELNRHLSLDESIICVSSYPLSAVNRLQETRWKSKQHFVWRVCKSL